MEKLNDFSKLKSEKLDVSDYANLPLKEDVLAIEEPVEEDRKKKVLYAQWKKLNIIRKNLKILDGYIQNNKGESLVDWLNANNVHIHDIIFKKVGKFNNDTGGISVYFLNLQNLYNDQEALYDKYEAESKVPQEDKKKVDDLREARGEKRKIRREFRKVLLKDLKKDNKGFLQVEVEEEPVAEVKKEEPELELAANSTNGDGEKVVKEIEKVKNNTGKIIVTIVGISLAVAVIYSMTSKKTT